MLREYVFPRKYVLGEYFLAATPVLDQKNEYYF